MKTYLAVCLMALLWACSDAALSPPPPDGPPPASQTISVAFCSRFTPLWLGYQDGDGAWTRAEPVVTGGSSVFQLAFSANRGAIATVQETAPGNTFLEVLYGTPEELTSAGISSPRFCGLTGVKTLLGSVAGIGDSDLAIIRAGFGSVALAHDGEDFSLEYQVPGPRDILAARETIDGAGDQRLTRLILRRDIDLPDNARIPVLDFDSPEAFAPVVAQVRLEGLGQDQAFILTQLRTGNFQSVLSIPIPGASGSLQQYYAIPEAELAAEDLQELAVTTYGGRANASRNVLLYFRSPVDRTVGFGPEIIAPTFTTVATTPSLRLRARFVPQDGYDREASVVYTDAGPGSVGVAMTAAYAALRGGYDLTNPDLSAVAGFDPVWGLTPAAMVRWSAMRIGGTLGLGADPVPADGAIRRVAVATDVITP